MTSGPNDYPIRAVAKLTGLSIETLRAWERRYRVVVPRRTNRGRVYTEAQIRRLRSLARAVRRGHSIGQLASLTDDQLAGLALDAEEIDAALGIEGPQPDVASGLDRIVDSIGRLDFTTANDELSRFALLLPPSVLVHQVALPLVRLAGERWHQGTFSIGQEHMTSVLLRNLLGSIARIQKPSSMVDVPCLLFATPSGERHEFGILVASTLAASRALNAIYLGPDLPAEEIVRAAAASRAAVVVAGIASRDPGAETLADLEVLARTLPEHIELWVGAPEPESLLPASTRDAIVLLRDFKALDARLDLLRSNA